MKRKKLLMLECLGLFTGFPVVFIFLELPVYFLTIPLVIISVPVLIWLVRIYGKTSGVFWVEDREAEKRYIKTIAKRFLITSLILIVVLKLFSPDSILDFPVKNPGAWIIFVIIYPLVSVYPQELLYRAFFCRRYGELFGNESVMILFNAFLFCWAHIVFGNAVSIFYSFIGGMYFYHTYIKTRSLRMVCIEHAIYGIFLFTVGYSRYFLTDELIKYIRIL